MPGLKNSVKSARLLADGKKLTFTTSADGVTVNVPDAAPDKISSTVILKIKGAPEVTAVPLGQEPDGTVRLLASDADLHGGLQYESGGGKDNIGYWTNPEDTASWTFQVTQPGKFKLVADIAALASGKFEVLAGGQKLSGIAPVTGDYTNFKKTDLDGELDLANPGAVTLTVKPIADGWQPMNLRSVMLQQVK